MLLSKLILLVNEAITKEGAVSASYVLPILVSIIGFLLITLTGFAFNSLNNNVKELSKSFAKFQDDFHNFVTTQAGLNSKFEERTKEK